MPYVILVGEDNSLTATKKERIMQRQKLFDTLWFLADPNYKGYDMSKCNVLLEYVLPVSKKYCTDILTLSSEMYKDHLQYLLPLDTNITSEPGEIELQLTFSYADLDADGKTIQRVRKTSTTKINIIPISAWSDIVPDEALGGIDQRIIALGAQIQQLTNVAELLEDTKADGLKYDTDSSALQLTADGKEIGNTVIIDGNGTGEQDVVEF